MRKGMYSIMTKGIYSIMSKGVYTTSCQKGCILHHVKRDVYYIMPKGMYSIMTKGMYSIMTKGMYTISCQKGCILYHAKRDAHVYCMMPKINFHVHWGMLTACSLRHAGWPHVHWVMLNPCSLWHVLMFTEACWPPCSLGHADLYGHWGMFGPMIIETCWPSCSLRHADPMFTEAC